MSLNQRGSASIKQIRMYAAIRIKIIWQPTQSLCVVVETSLIWIAHVQATQIQIHRAHHKVPPMSNLGDSITLLLHRTLNSLRK